MGIRLALLISGSGSTAEAIISACQSGELSDIEPVIVITNNPDAQGIIKAQQRGINTKIIQPKTFKTRDDFANALCTVLDEYNIDIISQNGWMPLTPVKVVQEYEGRIINQHPGPLDPGREYDFGGKGMYGIRVSCARLFYLWLTDEEYVTEANTHFVTDKYDEGDLIQILKLDVNKFKSAGSVRFLKEILYEHQNRIGLFILEHPEIFQELKIKTKMMQKALLPLEHKNVIATLKLFVDGSVVGFKRNIPLIPDSSINDLQIAKKVALSLFK